MEMCVRRWLLRASSRSPRSRRPTWLSAASPRLRCIVQPARPSLAVQVQNVRIGHGSVRSPQPGSVSSSALPKWRRPAESVTSPDCRQLARIDHAAVANSLLPIGAGRPRRLQPCLVVWMPARPQSLPRPRGASHGGDYCQAHSPYGCRNERPQHRCCETEGGKRRGHDDQAGQKDPQHRRPGEVDGKAQGRGDDREGQRPGEDRAWQPPPPESTARAARQAQKSANRFSARKTISGTATTRPPAMSMSAKTSMGDRGQAAPPMM